MRTLLSLVVLMLSTAAISLHAETIVLKSGKTLEGQVLSKTATGIVLRTVNGTLELRDADVAEVRAEAPTKGSAPTPASPAGVSQSPEERDRMRKIAGGSAFSDLSEKPQKCPKCEGTGFAIWLECLNCNKSGKPGYRNMGDYWEMCKRCSGVGRIAAVRCNTCMGKGNVLLSQIKPADGGHKDPPKGMKWCDACDGTGVAIWSECSQCKRSKYPGYLFYGDSLQVCNRCNGAGKFAGLGCGKCKQKGILPLEVP